MCYRLMASHEFLIFTISVRIALTQEGELAQLVEHAVAVRIT